MHVPVQLPRHEAPVRIVFDREERLSLDDYVAFCHANPDLRIERTAKGEIVLMPPAGYESSDRNAEVTEQLRRWAKKDGRGRASDSSAQFVLPDGSAMSPDAAWVSNQVLQHLTPRQRRGFPPLCPEFVVEVMSPSDHLKQAKAKMDAWMKNGAQLGWLIDGDEQTVHIYRPGQPAEVRVGPKTLAGEGPVKGFVLRLATIWKGVS